MTDDVVESGDRRWLRKRETVVWSQAVADRICTRVSRGELLYEVCRSRGMPTAQSVGRWARERPEFGDALMEARSEGGRPAFGGGGVWTYSQDAADAVFQRMCEGESLTVISMDPAMPCLSTLFYWRRRIPDFDAAVRLGMQIQAERCCDMGWALAREATPATAYLTHVRLTQLRWMAGVKAPRTFRLKAVEPEVEQKRLNVLMRTFKIEKDPVTGKEIVVSYCPNPDTGEVEREER